MLLDLEEGADRPSASAKTSYPTENAVSMLVNGKTQGKSESERNRESARNRKELEQKRKNDFRPQEHYEDGH